MPKRHIVNLRVPTVVTDIIFLKPDEIKVTCTDGTSLEFWIDKDGSLRLDMSKEGNWLSFIHAGKRGILDIRTSY